MSVNKNIFNRLKVFDTCLRQAEGSTKKTIMEKLSEAGKEATTRDTPQEGTSGLAINDRQFYNDLKTIETVWKVAIERKTNGKMVTYKYRQPQFTIFPSPVDDDLLSQIRKNLSYLRQFKGLPNFKFLDHLMAITQTEEADHSNSKIIVEFHGNPDLVGIDYFPTLLEAIQEKKALKINYYKSYNTLEEYQFCPYFLKQYNSRWFILGSKIEYPNRISTLALDRIKAIYNFEDERYIETDVNFDKEYFEDVVGATVLKNEKSVPVILKFTKNRYQYIKTKTIHLSQKEVKDKAFTICINVIPNRELESLILNFGEDVEVLEPESLRNVIKNRIDQMYKKYHLIKEAEIEVVK